MGFDMSPDEYGDQGNDAMPPSFPLDPHSISETFVNTTSWDTTMRIEGPPGNLEGANELGKAQETLDTMTATNRYDALQEVFGAREDGSNPFADWDATDLDIFLRNTLGTPEDFSRDYEAMTSEERAEHFPDPTLAELAALWADQGRNPDDADT